ncbi:hypothetical protein BC829DRAFT_30672 [Chytridium lagenaria]|nr:hypothetical protein BC829DRAFT_30672 [Chytridium lagenaria]
MHILQPFISNKSKSKSHFPNPNIVLLLLLSLPCVLAQPSTLINLFTVQNVTLLPTRTSTTISMTTTAVMVATSPASLPVQKVTEYTVFGGMPFQMVEGIAYQNNYISAIGPTYPNHGNQSQSTTSNPSELWQTAFNDSSPWLWSWSPMLGLDPNITTVPNTLSQNTTLNTTTYTALNVKHSKLQIDANMVFMVSPGAMTIDVLSYYHISPRKTYARDFPPRQYRFRRTLLPSHIFAS